MRKSLHPAASRVFEQSNFVLRKAAHIIIIIKPFPYWKCFLVFRTSPSVKPAFETRLRLSLSTVLFGPVSTAFAYCGLSGPICPEPNHLHSLMPNISTLYLLIFQATCALFPPLYIVLTFQFPMRSQVFVGLANGLIKVVPVMSPSSHWMYSSSGVRQVVCAASEITVDQLRY